MNNLFISFYWHFHQPYYKDTIDNIYLLPYTKIHLLKNYYMMAKIIEKNRIKTNFNFTPILLEQINDYEKYNSKCLITEYSRMSINLFEEHKEQIVKKLLSFLSINTLNRFERLKELSLKEINDYKIEDILDLITLFNLSLIPDLEKDEKVKAIEDKGRNYKDEDRYFLLEKQNKIIKEVLPLYKELFNENLIEITTSPYSHPIIPLIIDTDIAKRCGENNLPQDKFSHPEDIYEQIKLGNEIFIENFGKFPSGIWPPEGSVSNEVIDIFIDNDFKYFATDENILFKTLESNIRDNIYKTYFVKRDNKKISIFFRDKILSDLIGFRYSSMNEYDAVNDFISRVNAIKENLNRDSCLIVLLDGENPWEFYKNNGFDFLNLLYTTLSKEKNIILTTNNEILDSVESEEINYIESGSWVNGDFKTWIGDEEDNLSWNYLKKIRDDFEILDDEKKEKVKKNLFILEGSDWNWWYGKSYENKIKKNFDYLYRRHMLSFYLSSGLDVKNFVYKPIISDEINFINLKVKGYMKPKIDGKITDFYEWENGFHYDNEERLSEIHSNDRFFEYIKGGFDKENLYLAIKINKNFQNFKVDLNLNPKNEKYKLTFINENNNLSLLNDLSIYVEYFFDEILEIKLPFFNEIFYEDNKISFFVIFNLNNKPVSKMPQDGFFIIDTDEKNIISEWVV
ncbi:MAG TPA: glycoside hydrolase family 57 protein [Caldisericia bacterium]|nr:glycoside hydrolase family 57 protein [Caldisericia bacterium]